MEVGGLACNKLHESDDPAQTYVDIPGLKYTKEVLRRLGTIRLNIRKTFSNGDDY